ncbi:hypothetical protein GCM10009530_59860 [Microbispora corallina]|uniref:Uncharacterized protein n=1 Tax=Microbispora corallina TaxID=83302 RepID=A0ABQ4GA31_9ACTN|nr:hypothetical protein [Microbispora corallina]GIH43939.1 hypothetical protein Mco01_69390 [Microbispora corallina]
MLAEAIAAAGPSSSEEHLLLDCGTMQAEMVENDPFALSAGDKLATWT